MKLVKDVIQEGIDAYHQGCAFNECPHEPDDPVHAEGHHGGVPIGTVRVGINWQQIWEIGWNIGEMLRSQQKLAG